MSSYQMTQENKLSEKVMANLEEIELDTATSSTYFKPKPGTKYVVEIDLDQHRITPLENERFKDAQGKPLKRYELIVFHPNNGRQQTWTVSKTVVSQIIEEIRKGFKIFEILRIGEDRSTIYKIRGVQ
jgi:hypothetical protein